MLARAFGIEGFPGEKAVEARLWALAESLLPQRELVAYTQGLMDLGMPRQDACHYVHSSCVEITPCGQSGSWVFSPTINTPALLLDVMRESPDCESMAALLTAYERALRERVLADMRVQKLLQLERSRNGTDSLLSSCLVNDCLKAGKSVDEGGANYNYIMPTFLGLATLAALLGVYWIATGYIVL